MADMAARRSYTVDSESGLNLREQPSKDSNVLAVLSHGEKVTVSTAIEAPDGWTAVKGGGYVMTKYLK